MTEERGDQPHLIRLRDVAEWLADSVVKGVTLHRTTEQAAARIRDLGVEIEASRISSFGPGFYTATWTDLPEGLVDVAAVIDDLARIVSPRDPSITPEVAAGIRQHLLELGYDGVVVRDGGGDGVDYVVAILESSVRVVID